MNYIIKNHLSLLIILFLIISGFTGGSDFTPGAANDSYVNYPMIVDTYAGGTGSISVKDSGSITIGTSGTAVNRVNFGTCNFLPDATTIAASSTARVTCQAGTDTTGLTALTGVTSGDEIIITLSTTTAAAGKAIGASFGGLSLIGATASNTAGYIETLILNETGGTYTWPTSGTASGTASYIAIDP